ncbi:hypothetical protein HKI87_14g75800 [Chloropicon roscoffensis]|uniref:Uncharacterized protein n=1 Tax=Chloropicon roscoffensis TaxID=1461544 RepID=A0AAX4PJE5_9CHLO
MFSNSIASSHGAPRGPAPVLGLPLFGGGGRQPAEGNQVVIPTWVVICQHRTGSCYRGRREEFPDQVPPELANLITQHEWMARVVPEVTECLDRFVDPKYYNYLHVLLTIFFALQTMIFVAPSGQASAILKAADFITFLFFIPVVVLVFFTVQDGRAAQILNLKLFELSTHFASRGLTFYTLRDLSSACRLNFTIHCRISQITPQSRAGPGTATGLAAPAPVSHFQVIV